MGVGVARMAGYAQPRGAILRRCARHSIGTGRLVDGIAALDWRSGDRKLVGRFQGFEALLTISKQSGYMLVHQFSHKGFKCFCCPFF